jgi:hypothetical protein
MIVLPSTVAWRYYNSCTDGNSGLCIPLIYVFQFGDVKNIVNKTIVVTLNVM